MWRNRRIKWNNPYCILAILLTLSCLFIYLGFIFGNKFFMFGGIGSDTKSQYVMWYSSIADKLRTGTFSLWDFKNGFGANISIEGIYDPFQILIYLFVDQVLKIAYHCLILFRLNLYHLICNLKLDFHL